MIRLFVGLELPERTRDRLAGLCSGVPGARWVAPENLHLTLRFIGEVDYDAAEEVDSALQRLQAPAFTMTLEGAGIFGKPAAARVLWVGVRRCEPLIHLQAKVKASLRLAGLDEEERKFSPHVTLARLRNAPAARLQRFVAANAHFLSEPVPVARFVLFSSLLTRDGAVYTPESYFPLTAA